MAKDTGKGNERTKATDKATPIQEVAAQFDAPALQERTRATLGPIPDLKKLGFVGEGDCTIHIPNFNPDSMLKDPPSKRDLAQAAKYFGPEDRIKMPSMKS